MLGLAYEAAIGWVGVQLASKGRVNQTDYDKAKPWKRIELIRKCVPAMQLQVDDASRAERALDYADTIRDRRNQAGHPVTKWPFDDRSEVEDLLVQAGNHMPAVYELHAKA